MIKRLIGIVVLSVLFSSFSLLSTQVEAGNSHKAGHCYHTCHIPTPTLVPTPKDCEGGETYSVRQKCPPIVTPTPTEEATPSATPTEAPHQDVSDGLSSSPDATLPHSATCTIPFNAPLLQGFTRVTPTSVNFSWWGVSTIDKYALIYGYSPEALIYGVDNIGPDATSLTIDSLEPNRTVWAQLLAYKGGCASYSAIIDP